MRDLLLLFFRLGATSFGGPAAHIAMMQEEVVRRRAWLGPEEFLDLLGAANLIPGPNSSELAMHLGWRRAGVAGLVGAGISFILPAVAITALFAWAYVRFGTLPALQAPFAGIRAAVLAVIGIAVLRLGRTAVKSRPLALVGTLVFAAALLGVSELILLFAGGVVGACWLAGFPGRGRPGTTLGLLPAWVLALGTQSSETAASLPTLSALGLFFLKVGSVLYGSGYVLIAFLQGGLVERYGWLTRAQLVDAVAAGQFTPGPVLSTATFVGYLVLGPAGAMVATAAIFLPSFVLVAVTAPHVHRLRQTPWLAAFLDSVNVAALGLMAAVTIQLARSTLTGPAPGAIALAGLLVALRWKVNPAWLVLSGALLGWLAG